MKAGKSTARKNRAVEKALFWTLGILAAGIVTTVSVSTDNDTGGTLLMSRVENGRIYFETDKLGSFYFSATQIQDDTTSGDNFWNKLGKWLRDYGLYVGIGAGVLLASITTFILVRKKKKV